MRASQAYFLDLASEEIGPPLMLIQCKRYKNVVGIEMVKAFWTDVDFEAQ